MSRASQRNALLIQHCYSPYRTTQFEKTIKKRQKGPVLAIKGPFGDLGGPDLVPTAPHWPAWVGLMVTTYFDLVLGPFWVPRVPKRAHFGPNVPNFHGPIFVGYFLCSKYSLVGCPEHHNGKPCSSSTVAAHMEPSSLRTCIVLIRAPACYRVVHLVLAMHHFLWNRSTLL